MRKSLFAVLALAFAASTHAFASYEAGMAVGTITPEEDMRAEVCMGGFGAPNSRCGVTEVHDKLTVRAFVLADAEDIMAVAVLDAVGISNQLTAKIKEAISLKTGIPAERVLVSATHSHSGTDLQGVWGGASQEYLDFVVHKTAKTIEKAWKKRQAAEIYISHAQANTVNRRLWGFTDTDVAILDVRSVRHGERIGVIVNGAVHPTIVDGNNRSYSADFVHYLRNALEDELDGQAIFVNGVMGDVTANVEAEGRRGFEAAKEYGENLADAVLNAMDEGQEPITGDFKVERVELTHPITNPGILGGIAAGLIKLDINADKTITTHMTHFSFGDQVQGVTFPGEALTRLGAPIKAAMTAQHKLFFGLTDDTLGYFLPADEFLKRLPRMTEEKVSLDPMIGEAAKASAISLIQQ